MVSSHDEHVNNNHAVMNHLGYANSMIVGFDVKTLSISITIVSLVSD